MLLSRMQRCRRRRRRSQLVTHREISEKYDALL